MPELAPHLLEDETEIRSFLAQFPREKYRVHRVLGVGKFYLDELGSDVIKDVIRTGAPWEPHIIPVLERYVRPGSTAIDVGAHIGTHTLTIARLVGPDGKVYAFEPQRKLYRELHYNLELNGIRNAVPLRFALGNESKIIEMAPPPGGNEGATGIGKGGDRAEMRTLDSCGFTDVSLLKIDVEGLENEVLEGAWRTITRQQPVLVLEIMGGHHHHSAPEDVRYRIDQTIRKVESAGYAVSNISKHDYLARPVELHHYELDTIIDFTSEGNSWPYKTGWWSEPEPWGTWSDGLRAGVLLALDRPPQRDLLLLAHVRAFVHDEKKPRIVEVAVNGRTVAQWRFRRDDDETARTVLISRQMSQEADNQLHLEFRMDEVWSPKDLGLSQDPRPLGIGIRRLVVAEQDGAPGP